MEGAVQRPKLGSGPRGAASKLRTTLNARLLDDLVRAQQQRLRNRQSKCFGGFEVDDQLQLGRLLDREVGGFRTLDDFLYVFCSALEGVGKVGAI
jgi:hypothetical protein